MNQHVVLIILLSLIISVPLVAATYSVKTVKGTVEVRHGVAEVWVPLKAGERLKPDDTIRTGKGSSAVVTIDGERTIRVPAVTIVEIFDLRSMDQDELILKLTMEFIRGIPSDKRDGGLETPSTTIVHGTDHSKRGTSVGETPFGLMRMNGARVLFEHAFYGTCVLRAKEVFRVYPDLQKQFSHRSIVADALEKVGLVREALNEYTALSNESLSTGEKAQVEKSIDRLKKVIR
ncbi:MAG: hypothetical protein V3U69_03600 [Bacteroidota bacterium]